MTNRPSAGFFLPGPQWPAGRGKPTRTTLPAMEEKSMQPAESNENSAVTEYNADLAGFDDAFDEAIEDQHVAEPEDDGDQEVPDGEPLEAEESEAGEESEAEETEEEAAQKPGDSAEGDKPEAVDWEERARQAEARMSSWDGRLKAAANREKELLAELEALKTSKPGRDSDTDESQADAEAVEVDQELEEFYEDYPSLKKPIELLIQKQVGNALKPFSEAEQQRKQREEEQARTASEAAHVTAISEAHTDWQEIVDSGELDNWVERQPSFLANTYKRVMQEGDTQEVIDLFTTFKGATGRKDETTKPDQGDEARESIRNRRSKQAVDGEAVRSRTGGAPRRASKDDFDGAFNEAVELDR